MKVDVLSSQENFRWDEFVNRFDGGTPYHLTAWKAVVERTYRHEPLYLMAKEGDEITGILPMFLVDSNLFGRCMVSVAHATYGGICAVSAEAESLLAEAASALAEKERVSFLELREFGKEREGFSSDKSYVTLVYELPEKFSLDCFRPEVRNRIRKALSLRLEVREGAGHIREFNEIFSRNMRDLGSPDFGLSFFTNILDEFPGRARVFVVSCSGKAIGGLVAIGFKRMFMVPWISSLREYHALCPNNFLYYEAMKHASEQGYREFDFGRSRWHSGTFTFKYRWGALPKQLYYNYLTFHGRKRPIMDPTNPRFKFLEAAWRNLPVCCTRALGPRIMRAIP